MRKTGPLEFPAASQATTRTREAEPPQGMRTMPARLTSRLIGYDLPIGHRTRYFAWVAPEPEHVHLGWQHGIWMTDPDGILRGAHLNLKKVRYVTYQPGDEIPTEVLARYTLEAAGLATLGVSGLAPR